MEEGVVYVIGPGTTTRSLMDVMGLDNTLLGVDVVLDHQQIGKDVSEAELLELIGDKPARIVITPIGGQGHILGRGNHQISPQVIRKVGKEHLIIVATHAKLKALNGRPLLVDTYDEELNKSLCGLIKVTTGYEESVLYRVDY